MAKAETAATKEQLIELMQYLSQNISVPTVGIGGGYAPIGTIISYMGTTAPQDYLICDGTTYNIADYKQLSDFFAAQFGSANFFGGDGVTTFAVPDLRGEFLRGTGTNNHTMSGASGYKEGNGANVGVHQSSTWHNRIGGDANTTETKGIYIGFNNTNIRYAPNKDVEIKTTKNITKNQITINKSSDSENADWSDYYTSRPTNTSVLYCIKAVVAGDVYSETERVVGTWIDGKPIYQKTIDCGSLLNADTKIVPTGITNFEQLVDAFGVTGSPKNISPKNAILLPKYSIGDKSTDISFAFGYDMATIKIATASDRTNIVCYFTLRYTKTTD